MSHAAMNWAMQQRGLKPAAFRVLLNLCDRHNPDHGCFPSQQLLADDCEMSRSTLNEHLNGLEEAQLLVRRQRRGDGNRQKSTRYFFPFEPDFDEIRGKKSDKKPSPESGHGEANSVSGNEPVPCPDSSDFRVRNPDSNPVREPVREPVTLSDAPSDAPERELSQVEVEKQFDRSWHEYDNKLKSSRETALKVWKGMIQEDRDKAQLMIQPFKDQWVEEGGTLGRLIAFQTYLKDRKFDELPEPKAVATGADGRQVLRRYGSAWMIVRLAVLRAEPKPVNDRTRELEANAPDVGLKDIYRNRRWKQAYPFVDRLDHGPMVKLEAEKAVAQDLLDECVSVRVGSVEWDAWKEYHERLDWPFIEPDSANDFVWFPTSTPENWKWYQPQQQEPAA